jgi:hypothetical protein
VGRFEVWWFGLVFFNGMATGLRWEDRLEGAGNFSPWKVIIILLFQENEPWDIVESTATKLIQVPANAVAFAAFNKNDVKVKRIILDAIKYHVVPHVSSKGHAYQMWDALTHMYQSTNENKKMVLREKMKSIWMAKSEGVTSYLTQITQVRDELAAVGEAMGEAELVPTALNGVSKPWSMFVQVIVGRENMPSWDRLWDDFVQEETRRDYLQGSSSGVKEEEENVALSSKGRKGKPKTQGLTGTGKQ